ncbi:MAG: CDP-glycerol glycerophosphotransferase family protein, partial [Synergistaceae bacterium]|nr:CDP-glycerol glycerophosphotransferase family protein [Synergistaceae bacterium]
LDRPIAITTDDLQNWKKGRGFALDLEKIHEETTEKISCDEELRDFIINLLKGNDPKKERRREIRDLANMHQDGNSALRVANFVIERLGIKL